MADQILSDAVLIAQLSDAAAAHSTNRQLLRNMLLSLAVTGRINGVSIDRRSDINIAPTAASLVGATLPASLIYSSLRYFGASPILSAPSLVNPLITGPLTLDPADPRIIGDSVGTILLVRTDGTTFFNIQFGGTTSAFPALQKNGAGLTVGLADGSARSVIDAKRFTALGGPITEAAPLATTYTASITLNATLGNAFVITATNGTAFTMNAPTGGISGQNMDITIKNTSGGALGVITWNAAFKIGTFTAPANGFQRTLQVRFNGTNWVDRRDIDAPN